MIKENENIIYKNIGGVEILQFKKLLKYEDSITHAYCLGINRNFRTGRKSPAKISEIEFAKAVNDYKSLSAALNIEYNNIIKTNQRHTDNVEIIYEKKGMGPNFETFEETDGYITDKKDIVLSTTNADCILLLFYDPVKKVIANVHSGWRGTLKRISIKTIEKMKLEYGCLEKDIIVCMCPSIRKCHFEVDEDVYQMFRNEFTDILNQEMIFEKIQGKWHIDTIEINKILLKNAGLLEENIIDSMLCSVCNKKYMHSYRAEGESYGLNTAIINKN